MFKHISIASILLAVLFCFNLQAQNHSEEILEQNRKLYECISKKMDIRPGLWRPMYESEQVAWISPPWESDEYIWFDFPEAIQIAGDFIYIGHVSKRFSSEFPSEKSAPWIEIKDGIRYEQTLPNGISFAGQITYKGENTAGLELSVYNGSSNILEEIMLLTCVYLDQIDEFDENTNNNKFVHTPGNKWKSLPDAEELEIISDGYSVGWFKESVQVSDLPVVVVKSSTEGHLIALTWFEATHAFTGNPNHPCVHADPVFHNLKPGQSQTIQGELIFFEGSIEEFETMFREKLESGK